MQNVKGPIDFKGRWLTCERSQPRGFNSLCRQGEPQAVVFICQWHVDRLAVMQFDSNVFGHQSRRIDYLGLALRITYGMTSLVCGVFGGNRYDERSVTLGAGQDCQRASNKLLQCRKGLGVAVLFTYTVSN